MSDQCAKNTDRELYREDTGDPAGSYYENSVHVTDQGDIGMNVGGLVIVKPIREWHSLGATTLDGATDPGDPAAYAATPGEFAARWNAASEERRAEIVRAWQDAAAAGHRCFEMDHDGQVDGLADRCPTPGYAGQHIAVGAGAVSPPYRCHGCGTWFTLPEAAPRNVLAVES